jgi:protoporphyrin/coproporphyrin ferrochelatase
MASPVYEALLFLSFGGPDKPEDVLPFLENVLRGRNVPRERMLEVAQNYNQLGGRSPINNQNRALIAALKDEFAQTGVGLPIYWGNRNWHPLLPDTIRQMTLDGVRRALVFVTSAYSSYSSCRQYLEDLDRARDRVGPQAPICDKLRHFYNHPGFVEPLIDRVVTALAQAPGAQLLFSAHSIPMAMAETSLYREQLQETARLVATGVNRSDYRLVYQSRSGPPSQPWLEPDVREALSEIAAGSGSRDVVIAPIGFISDHMEVKFDLDTQAREHAEASGLRLVRAATVGTHPRFVTMIRELVQERLRSEEEHPSCRVDCCPNPHSSGRPSPKTSC